MYKEVRIKAIQLCLPLRLLNEILLRLHLSPLQIGKHDID